MTYFPDLAPCAYFGGEERATALIAVAWLERGHEYSRGPVPEVVMRRLAEFRLHAWEPFNFFGSHNCDLCEHSPERTARALLIPSDEWKKGRRPSGGPDRDGLSCTNLFVPNGCTLFVAPEMILHYVRSHQYCPPASFCDALLACPDMGSDAYFTAMWGTTWADIERKNMAPGKDFDQIMTQEIQWYRERQARS